MVPQEPETHLQVLANMLRNTYYDIEKGYEDLHASFPGYKQMPVIGVTANFSDGNCTLSEGYYTSVLKAGGIPLLIPPYDEPDALAGTLDRIDGLVLTGGGDINPLFMGEEPVNEIHDINHRRDRQELLVARLAADRQIPMLGICRGLQVMNVAFGGKLYQDIHTQASKPGMSCLKHDQQLHRSYPSHTVTLAPDSLLAKIFHASFDTESPTFQLPVNSFHHQAVSEPAAGFRVCAQAADGIIEAIESTEYKSMIGVQWHPECMILIGDEAMMPLFHWLTAEAASFAEAKRVHRRIVSLDSHCDTPMLFRRQIRFDTRDPHTLVDLHKLHEGHLDAVIMVAYLKQLERTDEALRVATAKADQLISEIEQIVQQYGSYVDLAYTAADVARLKREGKKAIMLGIENGYAIGRDLSLVEHFRRRGVVYMTLCHNGDNDICDSARGEGEHGGLSLFGRDVIAEMNRVGMMVDLSHASECAFYDALACSRTPIVCSHSSCRALCDHPRNLTDDQLRALAHRGGVAQVCLYEGFLRRDGKAGLPDIIEHIHHMVNIMGIEHVGIGSDFDGDGGVPGCASASEIINLTRRLLAERYSEADIQRLWGGNFMRLMTEIQQKGIIFAPSAAC